MVLNMKGWVGGIVYIYIRRLNDCFNYHQFDVIIKLIVLCNCNLEFLILFFFVIFSAWYLKIYSIINSTLHVLNNLFHSLGVSKK